MDRHKLILGEMTHNLCYKIVSEHTYTHTHTSTTVHRWLGWTLETGYSPFLHVFRGIVAVAVSEEGGNMAHTYMMLTVVGRVVRDVRRGER